MSNRDTPMNEIQVAGCVIDICTRSFLLIADNDDCKHIQADSVDEFMAIMIAIYNKMDPDLVEYAEPALTTDY